MVWRAKGVTGSVKIILKEKLFFFFFTLPQVKKNFFKCIIPPPFPFVPPVCRNFLMITNIREKTLPSFSCNISTLHKNITPPSKLYVSFQQGLACSLRIWHIFDQYFESPTQWAQNLAGGICYRTMWWIFSWGIWGKSCCGEPPGTWSDVDSALMSARVCVYSAVYGEKIPSAAPVLLIFCKEMNARSWLDKINCMISWSVDVHVCAIFSRGGPQGPEWFPLTFCRSDWKTECVGMEDKEKCSKLCFYFFLFFEEEHYGQPKNA